VELHDVDDTVRIGVNIAYNREPVTGQVPSVIIQRQSDLLFFDGSEFVVVRNELRMTEADSSNLPGYYYYDFDQGVDGAEEEYLVRLKNTGTYKFVADEWHRFVKARATAQKLKQHDERITGLLT
jgi:hypothetical protein